MERKKNYSHKRQAILELLNSTTEHPDAEWIYKKLKEKYPKLSLGTVYRNIAEFKEEGNAASVAVVGGVERIDGNTDAHPHFICKKCNAVIDVQADIPLDELCEQIEKRYCMECHRAELTFLGICADCAKKDN